MKKILYIALVATVVACSPKAIEPETLYLSESQAQEVIQKGTLLTINQFLDSFMTEEGNYLSDTSLYRTRATSDNKTYLFSIDTIAPRTTPVYIRGRITTDDAAGNFYKVICIQQIVENEQQALRISIDAGSIGGLYQIGQEILIRVDGLAIGRYANQPQLCVPTYNNNTYAQNAEQKVGWAPGRIPMAMFKQHCSRIGLPDVKKLVCDTLSITDYDGILNYQETRYIDAKLVCIKNVHYTGQYFDTYGNPVTCTTGDPETDGNANVFAPTTNNVGYPQGRVIADEDGNVTGVSTSEYAKYARYYLPGADETGVTGCANYVGTVTGILGFYRDNAKYSAAAKDWAIQLRSLDDLALYDSDGNLWERVEYSE